MKKSFMLLVSALVLVGCENINGTLEAYENLSFAKKKKTIRIGTGNHDARIKFRSKKKLQLVFTDGRNKKVEFRIPKGTKLPQYNGSIHLSSAQVKQPYDLDGVVRTAFSSGPRQRVRENCTVTRHMKECTRDENGERVCVDVTREIDGHKRVVYHYEYEDKDLVVDLKLPNSQAIVASSKGDRHTSKKVIDRESPCRIR